MDRMPGPLPVTVQPEGQQPQQHLGAGQRCTPQPPPRPADSESPWNNISKGLHCTFKFEKYCFRSVVLHPGCLWGALKTPDTQVMPQPNCQQ